jgi:hypothetical protein
VEQTVGLTFLRLEPEQKSLLMVPALVLPSGVKTAPGYSGTSVAREVPPPPQEPKVRMPAVPLFFRQSEAAPTVVGSVKV